MYAGSDNPDEVGWYVDNAGEQLQPVGQLMPNELGLYDMSGNLTEWGDASAMRTTSRNYAAPDYYTGVGDAIRLVRTA